LFVVCLFVVCCLFVIKMWPGKTKFMLSGKTKKGNSCPEKK
jgi:hypothetical protein